VESHHADLIKSLLRSLSTYASEHYPASSYGVYPYENKIAILLVANKYSPSNFWNGRWRSVYVYDPAGSELTGTINVNVHYYEDGNVALTTTKPVSITSAGSSASEIIRKIAGAEKAYQEELNRAFVAMNEQSFKALRRQLPGRRLSGRRWEAIGWGVI
jgi:capping protein (actin filament) muscle Z-line, alpha